MASPAMPRCAVSTSSRGLRRRDSRAMAVVTASMQVIAQRLLVPPGGRVVGAHKRILRQTLVQDFASSMRNRRTIEEPTAAMQVKASASSGPTSSIGSILHCWRFTVWNTSHSTCGSTHATHRLRGNPPSVRWRCRRVGQPVMPGCVEPPVFSNAVKERDQSVSTSGETHAASARRQGA